MRQHVPLARERNLHDELLLLVDHLGELRHLPCEAPVDPVEVLGIFPVDEDAVQAAQEVVPGGAEYRPLLGKLLPLHQDLFAQRVQRLVGGVLFQCQPVRLVPALRLARLLCAAAAAGSVSRRAAAHLEIAVLLQALQIRDRVVEAVHVVDPHPRHLTLPDQPEQELVGLVEHGLVLHPDGGQGVDVEKPAVVDLLRRHPPEGKAVHLVAQQPVQEVEARRLSLGPVEDDHVLVDEGCHFGTLLAELPEAFLDDFLLAMALRLLFRVLFRGRRQVLQRGVDAQELQQGRGLGGKEPLQALQAVSENLQVALRFHGDLHPGTLDEEAPFPEQQAQLAVFQHLAVLVAEKREQHLAGQLLFHRLPVDVEEVRVGRAHAVFQHVHPPDILTAFDAHVVRHEIEDVPHAEALHLLDHRPVALFAPHLPVENRLVHDIVAVYAPFLGAQVGGGVHVADPQIVEIAYDLSRIGEGELRVELEPIGGGRYSGARQVFLAHAPPWSMPPAARRRG